MIPTDFDTNFSSSTELALDLSYWYQGIPMKTDIAGTHVDFAIYSRCHFFESGLLYILNGLLLQPTLTLKRNYVFMLIENRDDIELFKSLYSSSKNLNEVGWVFWVDKKKSFTSFIGGCESLHVIDVALPIEEAKYYLKEILHGNLTKKFGANASEYMDADFLSEDVWQLNKKGIMIIQGILRNTSNQELANDWKCSTKMISYYKRNIMRQMNISSLYQLTWMASCFELHYFIGKQHAYH